jgi:hypothetical protein
MAEDEQGAQDLRAQILASVFGKVEAEDAVALVGILFEYRFFLSKECWALLRGSQKISIPLEPLEPTAASDLVAEVFGLDCDALFISFHRNWRALKGSSEVKGLVARIESHEHVDHLEPWLDVGSV